MGAIRARQVLSPNVNELLQHGYPSMRNQFVHSHLVCGDNHHDTYDLFSELQNITRNQHKNRQENEHKEREKQKDFYRFNVLRNKIAASATDETTNRVASVKPAHRELSQRKQSYISAVEVLSNARQELMLGM